MAEETGKALKNLGEKESGRGYLERCAKVSLVLFIFAWLAWNLFSEDFPGGAIFSTAIFSASFFLMANAPSRKLKKRAALLEKEMPFALMELSIDIRAGIPFGEALGKTAESGYGVFSEEIAQALHDSRKTGCSVAESLCESAERIGSKKYRRAISQLVSVYEHGNREESAGTIRRMALEQLSRQKSEAKEFSEKASVFSLAFIVVSAVVPALFQAFIIAGSAFIDFGITGFGVLAITAIGFPAIDLGMLLFIESMTPEFLRGRTQ